MFELFLESGRRAWQFMCSILRHYFLGLLDLLFKRFFNDDSSHLQDTDEMPIQQRMRGLLVSIVASVPIFGAKLAVRFGDEDMFSPEFIDESEISIKDRMRGTLSTFPLIGEYFLQPYDIDSESANESADGDVITSMPETADGKFEDEEQIGFKNWVWHNLSFPAVYARELVQSHLFNFREDEADDLHLRIHYLFFAVGKILVVILLLTIPTMLVLSSAGERGQRSEIVNPSRIADIENFDFDITRETLETEKRNRALRELAQRYEALDSQDAETNLTEINNISEKISIAKILANHSQYQTLARKYLLESNVEMILVCFAGSFGVPEQTVSDMENALNFDSEDDVEMMKLKDLSALVLKIAKADTGDWMEIESSLENLLLSYPFGKKQQANFRKIGRIANETSYFHQPNRIKEITESALIKLAAKER